MRESSARGCFELSAARHRPSLRRRSWLAVIQVFTLVAFLGKGMAASESRTETTEAPDAQQRAFESFQAGKTEEALAAIGPALEAARRESGTALVTTLITASAIYSRAGRLDEALAAAKEAEEHATRTFEYPLAAQAAANVALLYAQRSAINESVAAALRAASLYQVIEKQSEAAQVFADLAIAYQKAGMLSQAEVIARHVLATPEATSQTRKQAAQTLESVFRSEDRRIDRGLVWNAWFEKLSDAPFEPVRILRPGLQYRLVVDLSVLYYGGDERSLKNVLDQQLAGRWRAVDRTRSQIILVPRDANAIKPNTNDPRPLVSAIGKRMKGALDAAQSWPLGAAATMQRFRDAASFACESDDPAKLPSVVVGRGCLEFTAGGKDGPTTVAVLLLAGQEPVDQLWIPICVAADGEDAQCDVPPVLPAVTSAFASSEAPALGRAWEGAGAVLQYVSYPRETMSGILWNAGLTDPKYLTFRLDRTAEGLVKDLGETTSNALTAAITAKTRLEQGYGLYNLLLPSDNAKLARAAFERYLTSARTDPPAVDEPRHRIVVEMINAPLASPVFLPLDFAAPNLGTPPTFHIGQYFSVENPLPVSRPRQDERCISRWIIVLPPGGDSALDSAMDRLWNTRNQWRDAGPDRNVFLLSLSEFKDAMNDKQNDKHPTLRLGDSIPTGIIILSHQDANIVIHAKDDMLTADELEKPTVFKGPAMAILNGCSTGKPGSSELARKLNAEGVGTIIATSTGIKGEAAGQFLKCLDDTLRAQPGGIVARSALHRTRECMWNEFASQGLAYGLFGDGSVSLCEIGRR